MACWRSDEHLYYSGFCQSVTSEFAFENQSAIDLEMVEDATVYAKLLAYSETELPKLFAFNEAIIKED